MWIDEWVEWSDSRAGPGIPADIKLPLDLDYKII